MGEASHRTPFIWRYPRKFEPRKGSINYEEIIIQLSIFYP
jgi:hypothetical protein